MDPKDRIITRIPMNSIWNSQGEIRATRGRTLGPAEIQTLLREGVAAFVIANVGNPLRWLSSQEMFEVWKSELKPRVVDGTTAADKVSGFRLEDYPGSYCYIATEWTESGSAPIVLFEMHH